MTKSSSAKGSPAAIRPVLVAPECQEDDDLNERGYAKGRSTRRLIVEIASPLFAAQGFNGTSYDQIAHEAGMTKGAVSGHFKRKRDLYVASIKQGLSFFNELTEEKADLPAEEGLLDYLRWLGSHVSEDSNARAFLIQLMRDVDDEIRAEIIRTVLKNAFGIVRKHIEGVNPHIDSVAYSFIIFSSLLLDADQHSFFKLMADDEGRSHDMSATIRRLVGIVRDAKEY